MNPNQWPDQEIIRRIKDENARNLTLYELFNRLDWRGAAIRLLAKFGCGAEDAEEVANDALRYFDSNIRNDLFRGECSLKTHYLDIAKRQWWKRAKKLGQKLEFDDAHHDTGEGDVESIYLEEEQRQAFRAFFAQVGERCRRIFELSMLDKSTEEIAQAIPLSSAEMAKKESYRCRMWMRAFLEAHPIWKDRLK